MNRAERAATAADRMNPNWFKSRVSQLTEVPRALTRKLMWEPSVYVRLELVVLAGLLPS